MEKKGRKEGLLEKTAEVFDLPGDVVAGLPRVELLGTISFGWKTTRGSWLTALRRSISAAESLL